MDSTCSSYSNGMDGKHCELGNGNGNGNGNGKYHDGSSTTADKTKLYLQAFSSKTPCTYACPLLLWLTCLTPTNVFLFA